MAGTCPGHPHFGVAYGSYGRSLKGARPARHAAARRRRSGGGHGGSVWQKMKVRAAFAYPANCGAGRPRCGLQNLNYWDL